MSDEEDRFARSLRAAIDESCLSARELARRCTREGARVSAPTLRSWAAGDTVPTRSSSFEIVDVLERVLGLRAGELSTSLRASARPRFPEESSLRRLLSRVSRLQRIHGLPAGEELRVELLSTTLDRLERPTAMLRHRVVVSAAAEGVDGLLTLFHDGGREIGRIEISGGELLSVDRVDGERLGVAVRLPRPLEVGEVAVVDLAAPVLVELGSPGRLSTLSVWPASLIVAALRAEGCAYAGRAVRKDHRSDGVRIASRGAELLPGSTGMQCVARDVRAAEAAVEWWPRTLTWREDAM